MKYILKARIVMKYMGNGNHKNQHIEEDWLLRGGMSHTSNLMDAPLINFWKQYD